MEKIVLQGKSFTYIIRKKAIRSISLRLLSRHSFQVSCHSLTPKFLITKFIQDHESWILKNSSQLDSKKSLLKLKTLKIFDRSFKFVLQKMPRDSVVIMKSEQTIYANSAVLSASHIKKLIDLKLRPFALSLINQELEKLSQEYGYKYKNVTVKNTTSRFGSCSFHNNLNFNWQIILLPQKIFRHILLHELVHTIVKNHSRRFWLELSKSDPYWRTHRDYLKTQAGKHFIV